MSENPTLPIQSSERIFVLDVLRGFALLGVVVANLEGFITFVLPDEQVALMTSTWADKVTAHFLQLFVANKFITIFSLLFGYGFGVVIERVAAKGLNVNAFFIRRMLFLLLFGLLHLCFWWGEILNVYASSGLLLLLFRKVGNKGLLIWGAIFLFLGAPLVQGLKMYLLPLNPPTGDVVFAAYLHNIQHGGVFEIAQSNYETFWFVFIERLSQFRDMFDVLGKFLFGYYIMRMGYLKDLATNLPFFKKAWKITLAIALVYLAAQTLIQVFGYEIEGNEMKLAEYLFSKAGVLGLSLFYCSSIVIAYYRLKNVKLFEAFRYVGMMSLTNYLMHSAFYVLFFYGIGMGMVGKVHMYWVVPIGVAYYALQAIYSKWWMQHFRYGPAEWVWRQLTYGKRLPIMKNQKT